MRNENVRKFTVSSLYLAIAVILIVGASVIPGFDLTLLAVDIAYAFVDPRIKARYSK